VHSSDAVDNLASEGIADHRVHFVGNTMIDTLVAMEERFRNLRMADRLGVSRDEYLLVTLHRPALVDGPLLPHTLRELRRIADDMPVVFPVHPRTRRMIGPTDIGAVKLIDPVGYVEFLSLEADARAVLTDSGGVQEETTFLRVPCYTLRDNTERPVTINLGTNTLLGLEPSRIGDLPALLAGFTPGEAEPPPLWDGAASARLVSTLVGDG
jgi:UDP-N-acetylglucosamine 2-epimerase (non-hydrolysing)